MKVVKLTKDVWKRVDLGDSLIVAVLLLFVFFFFTPYFIFFPFFALLCAGLYALAFLRMKSEDFNKKNMYYIVGVFSAISLFIIAVVFRYIGSIHPAVSTFLLILGFCIIGAGVGLVVLTKPQIKFSKQKLLEYLPILIMMGLVAGLSYDAFLFVPIDFDSNCYYYELSNIDAFTLNDRDALKLFGHMTHFYALFVFFIYSIIGNMFYASVLFNIICLMLSILMVYKIVKILCPDCKKWFAYLCVAVFAFAPFTFGFIPFIYAQTALMYATLFFIFACFLRDKFLIFISSLIVIFTFETGIIVVAIFIAVPVLISFIKSIFQKEVVKEIKRQVFNVFNICLLVVVALFIFIFTERNWAQGTESIYEGLGGIGFNRHFVNSHIVLINFAWVLIAVVGLAIIKGIVLLSMKKISISDALKGNTLFWLCALFFVTNFFMFMSLELLVHVRYLLPMFASLFLVFFASLHYLFKGFPVEKIKGYLMSVLMMGLIAIMFISSYITIDPIMRTHPRRIYMGSGDRYTITFAGTRNTNFWSSVLLFDGSVYNKQMLNFRIAINRAFRSMEYNHDTAVLANINIYTWFLGGGWGWNDDLRQLEFVYFSEHVPLINSYRVRIGDNMVQILYEDEYNAFWFLDFNSRVSPSIGYYVANHGVSVIRSHSVSFRGWRFTMSKIQLANYDVYEDS